MQNMTVFLFHVLAGATKKVCFGIGELPGANIHKPQSTDCHIFSVCDANMDNLEVKVLIFT